MKIAEMTKKEIIINSANQNPFLKISEIAANAETTPRYVRTILSEADISLMELRREAYDDLKTLYETAIDKIVDLEDEVERYEYITGSH